MRLDCEHREAKSVPHKGIKARQFCRQIISFFIIVSMLWTDVANALPKGGSGLFDTGGDQERGISQKPRSSSSPPESTETTPLFQKKEKKPRYTFEGTVPSSQEVLKNFLQRVKEAKKSQEKAQRAKEPQGLKKDGHKDTPERSPSPTTTETTTSTSDTSTSTPPSPTKLSNSTSTDTPSTSPDENDQVLNEKREGENSDTKKHKRPSHGSLPNVLDHRLLGENEGIPDSHSLTSEKEKLTSSGDEDGFISEGNKPAFVPSINGDPDGFQADNGDVHLNMPQSLNLNNEDIQALKEYLNNLPEEAKTQLQCIKRQFLSSETKVDENASRWTKFKAKVKNFFHFFDIDTKTKALGAAVGIGLTVWLGFAMPWLFGDGLIYLFDNYTKLYEGPWGPVLNGIGEAVYPTVITLMALDGIRQASSFKNLFASLRAGEVSAKRTVLLILLCLVPAAIEPGYLVLLVERLIKDGEEYGFPPKEPKSYLIDILWKLSWPLFINSLKDNMEAVNETWGPSLSKEGASVEDLLEKLTHYLYRTQEKEKLKDIDAELQKIEHLVKTLRGLTETQQHQAQVILTYNYLLALVQKVPEEKKPSKPMCTKVEDGVIGTILVSGSPTRALLLYAIISSMMSPGYTALKVGFTTWGFLGQTKLEGYGMKECSHNFMREKDPHDHKTCKPLHVAGKVLAVVPKALYSLFPLGLSCLSVVNEWSWSAKLLIAAIPFLIAEGATIASTTFGKANELWVKFFAKVTHEKIRKKPGTSYVRDQVMEKVKTLKDRVSGMHSSTLKALNLEEKSLPLRKAKGTKSEPPPPRKGLLRRAWDKAVSCFSCTRRKRKVE